jgi:hypothetical protein
MLVAAKAIATHLRKTIDMSVSPLFLRPGSEAQSGSSSIDRDMGFIVVQFATENLVPFGAADAAGIALAARRKTAQFCLTCSPA